MKYLNGQLRNESEATLCLKARAGRTLNREEYLPIVVLCVVLAILLLNGWLG